MQTVTRWKLQLRHLLHVGESRGYMAACAALVTHQSQECMGVLTDTTIQPKCGMKITQNGREKQCVIE